MSTRSNSDRGNDPRMFEREYGGGTDSMAVRIVQAIADAKGHDLADIDFRLYDYIDPDALDDLYNHSKAQDRGAWKVDFAVNDVRITLYSDGRITVY